MYSRGEEKTPLRDPLISEFLDYLRVERRLAANSIEAYRRDLGRYAGFLESRGGVALHEVEVPLLRDYLAWMTQRGLAATSRARGLAAVRSFYRFLLLDGRIARDPTEFLEAPRGWRKLPRYLSGEEVDRLLAHPDRTTRTGLRDALLGSVSQSLAHSSPVPVTIVRHAAPEVELSDLLEDDTTGESLEGFRGD